MKKFFKKIINSFLHFAGKIGVECWWIPWSNFYFRKSIRSNIGIKEEDRVFTVDQIKKLTAKLYNKFTWTEDGPEQLFDAVTPPPQNYQNYLDGGVKDDCDGFHSLVFHCLYNSGIECYLMTANAIKAGHCLLIFRLDGLWHVDDYFCVYKGYEKIDDAIADYNKRFPGLCGITHQVFYNGFLSYDYETEKLKKIKLSDLRKRA